MYISGKQLKVSKIKYTTAYPTSIIVNGLDKFGLELTKSLTSQGGYVIIVGDLDSANIPIEFLELENTSFLDLSGIANLVDEIRRLDYIFFLNHSAMLGDGDMSSQDFLVISSYLNQLLNLAAEFESLFLFTDSLRLHKWKLTSDDRYYHDLYSSSEFNYSEFVRYAENLILEFNKSKKLEVKILRIAELLGDGVELNADTNIGKLLPQGLAKKNLYLDEDGLAAEYYVHILDAVYGTLKAQFSRNLPSNIYSLSYTEPVTQLSLAYRIQENLQETGDIKFVDEENSKVRLNLPLYKPAPNLQQIGWSPKVDFNTALMQTIAYYQSKLAGLEKEEAKVASNLPLATKNDQTLPVVPSSALSKLIAEKKGSDESQKLKLARSVSQLEQKKRKIPLSKKIRKRITRAVDKFKNNFQFLQKLTLTEFGVYVLLLGIFLVIFLTVLSPIIGIVRDFVLWDNQNKQAITALSAENWQEYKAQSSLNLTTLDSLKKSWQDLEFLFNLTAKQNTYQNGLGLIQAKQFLLDSQISFSESMQQVEALNKAQQVDLIYRPTNSSIWGLDNSGFNSSAASGFDLVLIKGNYENSVRSFDNYQRVYQQINQAAFPDFLTNYLSGDSQKISDYSKKLSSAAKTVSYLSTRQQPSFRLAIVLQDHLRGTFSGGEVTSLGLLDYENGVLSGAQFLPIQNIDTTGITLTPAIVNELDSLSKGQIPSYNSANLVDLARFAYSPAVKDALFKLAYKKVFGNSPDAIIYLNTASFSDLLSVYGGVEINSTNIDASNYLQTITNLQKQSTQSRNLVLTNLAGITLSRMFNNSDKSLNYSLNLLADLQQKNELEFNSDLKEIFVESEDPADIKVAMLNTSPTQFNVNPSLDWNVNTTLEGDVSTNRVKVNTTNTNGATNLMVCGDNSNITFNTDTLAPENFFSYTFGNEKCLIFTTTRISEFNFSYQKPYLGDNYSELFQASMGLNVRYDYQIDYPISKKILTMNPEARQQLNTGLGNTYNSLFYSGEVYNQFRFNITFSANV